MANSLTSSGCVIDSVSNTFTASSTDLSNPTRCTPGSVGALGVLLPTINGPSNGAYYRLYAPSSGIYFGYKKDTDTAAHIHWYMRSGGSYFDSYNTVVGSRGPDTFTILRIR